ncbi:MAG: hypothetical protein AAGH79_09890 [Bacteroidota bacterium]
MSAEMMVLAGGPYGFTFRTTDPAMVLKDNPYKALHLSAGAFWEWGRPTRRTIGLGVASGFRRYEIPIGTQSSTGTGGSVVGYFDPQYSWLLSPSVSLKQAFSLGPLSAAIIPSYHLYWSGLFTHSLGLNLSISF